MESILKVLQSRRVKKAQRQLPPTRDPTDPLAIVDDVPDIASTALSTDRLHKLWFPNHYPQPMLRLVDILWGLVHTKFDGRSSFVLFLHKALLYAAAQISSKMPMEQARAELYRILLVLNKNEWQGRVTELVHVLATQDAILSKVQDASKKRNGVLSDLGQVMHDGAIHVYHAVELAAHLLHAARIDVGPYHLLKMALVYKSSERDVPIYLCKQLMVSVDATEDEVYEQFFFHMGNTLRSRALAYFALAFRFRAEPGGYDFPVVHKICRDLILGRHADRNMLARLLQIQRPYAWEDGADFQRNVMAYAAYAARAVRRHMFEDLWNLHQSVDVGLMALRCLLGHVPGDVGRTRRSHEDFLLYLVLHPMLRGYLDAQWVQLLDEVADKFRYVRLQQALQDMSPARAAQTSK